MKTVLIIFALAITTLGVFVTDAKATKITQNDKINTIASPNATDSSIASSSSVAKTDSYTLFWPITAGKVRGDKLYFAKKFKESFRNLITFSDYKKSDYEITLSEKRIVEAEKLYQLKDYENGLETLKDGHKNREKALEKYKKAENIGRYMGDIKNRLKESLKKQRLVLEQIKASVDDSQKQTIDEQLQNITSIESSLPQ